MGCAQETRRGGTGGMGLRKELEKKTRGGIWPLKKYSAMSGILCGPQLEGAAPGISWGVGAKHHKGCPKPL